MPQDTPVAPATDLGSPLAVLLTVCIVQFMVPFMLTAVGVALPSLGRELSATAMQLSLVEQLYVLSLAMTMLTFGRLGDILGQRRVLLAGLVVFTVLTLSLGLTESVHMVMAQRFFQGLGAAMMLSGSLALVAAAYPPHMRARKIGIVSACTYAGLSLGPVAGGYVTSHVGWRGVFLMSAPIALAATVMCLFFMRQGKTNASGDRLDWPGSLAYAASVGIFMTGAAHAEESHLGYAMIAAGICGLLIFLRMESRSKSPLLDVRLFTQNRFFALSCLAALGNYAATFGITFLMSLYLQYAKGLPPRLAGLVLLTQPVCQVGASLVSGRLAERFEPSRLASAGILASAAGLSLGAASIGTQTPLWQLYAELALIGTGFGIFITPNSTAIMASVQKRQYGVASGMVGTMRTLGMAVSMTSVTLIFSLLLGGEAVSTDTLPRFLDSMRLGLWAFAAYAGLGLLASFGRGKKSV